MSAVIQESLGKSIDVVVSPPRPLVEDHLSRARILWHAAGLSDDIHLFPERAEHFGIVTAEAMSYGCVPVVFDGGGQREIVEHGVSGFLCRGAEDIESRTLQLMRDPALLERMATNAVTQSMRFRRSEFRRNVFRLVPELALSSVTQEMV